MELRYEDLVADPEPAPAARSASSSSSSSTRRCSTTTSAPRSGLAELGDLARGRRSPGTRAPSERTARTRWPRAADAGANRRLARPRWSERRPGRVRGRRGRAASPTSATTCHPDGPPHDGLRLFAQITCAAAACAPRSEPAFPVPFVVGVGRSGTTLLRLMLDAHPELAIPPETHFIPQFIQALRASSAFQRATLTKAIVQDERRRWNDFGLDEADLLPGDAGASSRFNTADALRAFYPLYAEQAGQDALGRQDARLRRAR